MAAVLGLDIIPRGARGSPAGRLYDAKNFSLYEDLTVFEKSRPRRQRLSNAKSARRLCKSMMQRIGSRTIARDQLAGQLLGRLETTIGDAASSARAKLLLSTSRPPGVDAKAAPRVLGTHSRHGREGLTVLVIDPLHGRASAASASFICDGHIVVQGAPMT